MLQRRVLFGSWISAACLLGLVAIAPRAEAAHKKKSASKKHGAIPPIAFYMANFTRGETAALARAACRKELENEARKRPHVHHGDPKVCDSVDEVRGPYKRGKLSRADREFGDDAKIFVYRGKSGEWYDKDGLTACFAAGTKVDTPDGPRAIETLHKGETVIAWDVEHARPVVAAIDRTKERPQARIATLTFANGTSLEVTSNHPFLAGKERRWTHAGKLHVGDTVYQREGDALRPTTLLAMTAFDREAPVYDVTIHAHHNYFAGGVLVHNY